MDPRTVLAKLAQQSAAAWQALGQRAFRGDTMIETKNTLYAFHNGVFVSRARKPTRASEAPSSMRDVRLIGFLADEGGLWSLSCRWRPGALAVLWKPNGVGERSFLLTSATVDFAHTEPEPRPEGARPPQPSSSDVFVKARSRPPTLRRPQPPSMTRVHPAAR